MLGVLPLATEPVAALPTTGPAIVLTTAPYTTMLAEILFTSPTLLTVRVAERYLPPTITGNEWTGLILGWGDLAETVDGGPGEGELLLTNSEPIAGKPRFSDLLRTPLNTTGTYELIGAQVTLSRLVRGGTTPTPLGVLFVETAPDLDDRQIRLRLRDASLRLEHQAPVTLVNRTDFPSCAADLVGTALPWPFGSLLSVPLLPVVGGTLGKITNAIDATTTTSIGVIRDDGSQLDATDLASHVILIDWEEVTFTGISSGFILTGVTRGANGSTAAAHDNGAPVFEILSTYVYAIGEHAAGWPISSLTNVRAQGALTSSGTVNTDQVIAGHHLGTLSIARSAIPALSAVTPNAVGVSVASYSANLV